MKSREIKHPFFDNRELQWRFRTPSSSSSRAWNHHKPIESQFLCFCVVFRNFENRPNMKLTLRAPNRHHQVQVVAVILGYVIYLFLPSFLKLMIFRSPLATPILMNFFRERRMWTNDGFTLFCCISGNLCNDLSISLLACNRNSDGFLYRDKTENDGISSILWISWSICNPSFNPLCLQLKFQLLFLKTTICPGYMFQSTWKECGLNVALCSVLMNFSGYFAIFESPLFAAATLHDILEDNNLLSLMFQSIW